jgi:hypothetical protein
MYGEYPVRLTLNGLLGKTIDVRLDVGEATSLIGKMRDLRSSINDHIDNSGNLGKLCKPNNEDCCSCHIRPICPYALSGDNIRFFKSNDEIVYGRIRYSSKELHSKGLILESIGGCIESDQKVALLLGELDIYREITGGSSVVILDGVECNKDCMDPFIKVGGNTRIY